MPRSVTGASAPESGRREEEAQATGLAVEFTDDSGRRRRGSAIFLPKYGDAAAYTLNRASGEEFRILILAEPPAGPLVPPEDAVICAPARPLSGAKGPQRHTSKPAG